MGGGGLSAYEIAINNGFRGTEEDWLNSLKGADGKPFVYDDFTQSQLNSLIGPPGSKGATGSPGPIGPNGKEVEFNVSGTKLQWRYSGSNTWLDLFDIPQPSLIFSPHKWTNGVEVNLGDGSYGIRAKGNIVQAANVGVTVFIPTPGITSFLDCGGLWESGQPSYPFAINTNIYLQASPTLLAGWSRLGFDTIGKRVGLSTYSTTARTGIVNNSYDVWVRYIK